MKRRLGGTWVPLLAAACALSLSGAARAVDGVIEINQARALAGGVTTGDTAGFPVELNEPGSYRLTSNLTVPDVNTDGILIAATTASVIIDMNGFLILGPGSCGTTCPLPGGACTTGTGRGVATSGTVLGVGLRNGGIRGMGAEGVHVTGSLSLDRVYASGNGADGFRVTASGGFFTDSIASFNGGDGFVLDDNFPAQVRGVTSTCNGANGIEVGGASNLTDNTSVANLGVGIHAGTGSHVEGNTMQSNFGTGLTCAGSPGYAQNVLTANGLGGGGLDVGAGCVKMGENLCGGAPCP